MNKRGLMIALKWMAAAIPPLLIVFVLIPLLNESNRREREAWERAEAEQAASGREPFERSFASAPPLQLLDFCRTAIEQSLPYWQPVVAIAFARERIDAYYWRSLQLDSLQRVSCQPQGIVEQRVEHPLAARVRAWDAARRESLENDDMPALPGLWELLRQRVEQAPFDRLPVLLELVVLYDSGAVWQRSTLASTAGAAPQRVLQPTDAADFPSLSSLQAAPAGLALHARSRWSSSADAAFALLQRELPTAAAITQARFDDDAIDIGVKGPMPGLAAPYGTIEWDAWGERSTWLYPYDGPTGFGCTRGISLDELRRRFSAACSALPGCRRQSHFSIADYSCSRGRSNGGWTLHLQTP